VIVCALAVELKTTIVKAATIWEVRCERLALSKR
jgi:hypothetical protein